VLWEEDRAPATTIRADGTPAPAQVVWEDGTALLLVEVEAVPPLGYRAYPLIPYPVPASAETPARHPERNPARSLAGMQSKDAALSDALLVTPDRLENRFWRIELNRVGQIRSLYDKRARREVLARQTERDPGRANVFQAFEDKPMNFDAWDIDIYYQEKVTEITGLVEAVVEETGPVRGTLRLVWRHGASTITQRMSIYRASPRIDFRTEVDWWEQQVLLKVAFPVAVRSTRATYEIQFGSIERPTHWNTSWDYARFEVVGHKWADLSEGGYGVSLLNDCKYGHDIKGNTLRLTLLKSAVAPDESADKGRHEFTYSLLPHEGDWRQGETVREAHHLNYPLAARMVGAQAGLLPREASFAAVSADHVIVETVKQAEDEDARGRAWIVRVYDWQQRRSDGVRLRFGRAVTRAVACDLIERTETPARVEQGEVVFDIKPFEVRTFKVWLE
jgi:alpha-mannosidase